MDVQISQFPHMVQDGMWSSCVILLNNNIRPESVIISVRRGTAVFRFIRTLDYSERITINGDYLNTVPGNPSTPFSVSIMHSVAVSVTGGLINASSGQFSLITPVNAIGAALYNGSGVTYTVSNTINSLYEFYGMNGADCFDYIYGIAVDSIINAACMSFGRSIAIGDCCMAGTEGVPGHPPGTHIGWAVGGGKTFDMNYPRYGGGYTFYRPTGATVSPIILGDSLVPEFFNHNFFVFIIDRLRGMFPDIKARVDTRIKNFLVDRYPSVANILIGDDNGLYGHDSHAHIELGNKINY